MDMHKNSTKVLIAGLFIIEKNGRWHKISMKSVSNFSTAHKETLCNHQKGYRKKGYVFK